MNCIWMRVHAPMRAAVVSARAVVGTEDYLVCDDDLRNLPTELANEFTVWSAEGGEERAPAKLKALTLDHPDPIWKNIVAALRREHDSRVEHWLALPSALCVDHQDFAEKSYVPKPELTALSADRRIAAKLRALEAYCEEREQTEASARDTARAGLRAYALRVDTLSRAAREDYEVEGAALEHFVAQIRQFDDAAVVYSSDSEEWKRSRCDDRKAPDLVAFEYLDRVRAHVDALDAPEGVEVRIDRIKRLRQATIVRETFEGPGEWRLQPPVTAVLVTIDARVVAKKLIFFVAER